MLDFLSVFQAKESSPALEIVLEKSENQGTLRKSARTTRYKSQIKGKSRRNIFKKVPFKTPKFISVQSQTKDQVFHDGIYYQTGDIVALEDAKGQTYYAQIRMLLVDTYMEKSAVLTWLIPTTASPPPNDKFDASTYLIGLEEDIPRKLEYMTFVCNAPSNYYHGEKELNSIQIYWHNT